VAGESGAQRKVNRTEMKMNMIRWKCGFILKEKQSSEFSCDWNQSACCL